MRSSFLRNWLCGIVLLLLSACGGGGSSDSSTTGTTTPDASTAEGHFIDSAVSGLTYICGDITGRTDGSGSFIYYADQKVTFMVGDIVLGTVYGAVTITPLELVGGGAGLTHPTVINLIRFIQSLDDDGDPENGIVISSDVAAALENITVDFDVSVDAFASAVASLFDELPDLSDGTNRTLRTEIEAVNHFQATLSGGDEDYDLDDLIEISEEEFNNFGSTGVWRYIGKLEGTTTIEDEEAGSWQQTTGFSKYVDAMAEKNVDGYRYFDSCWLDGFVAADSGSFQDTDESMCEGESWRYYKSQDEKTAYMTVSCDGDGVNVMEWTMLSDAPVFDLGSASLSFDFYPAVAATNGICGSLRGIDQEVSYDILGQTGTSHHVRYEIEFRVPYKDNYLYLNFSFPEKPVSGEYTIVKVFDEDQSGEASLTIKSASEDVFGADLENIIRFRSLSGTLTLNRYTETAASGKFNITVEEPESESIEKVSGEFDLSIE